MGKSVCDITYDICKCKPDSESDQPSNTIAEPGQCGKDDDTKGCVATSSTFNFRDMISGVSYAIVGISLAVVATVSVPWLLRAYLPLKTFVGFAIVVIIAVILETLTFKKERATFTVMQLSETFDFETSGPIILSSMVVFAAIIPGLIFFGVDILKSRKWTKTAVLLTVIAVLSLSVSLAAWVAIMTLHSAAQVVEHAICKSTTDDESSIMDLAQSALNDMSLVRTTSFVASLIFVAIFVVGTYYFWRKPLIRK